MCHKTDKPTESSDAEYLTRRIARDNPELLERMKAGEFKSVRAAAIEAGIVKPRLSVPGDVSGLTSAPYPPSLSQVGAGLLWLCWWLWKIFTIPRYLKASS